MLQMFQTLQATLSLPLTLALSTSLHDGYGAGFSHYGLALEATPFRL